MQVFTTLKLPEVNSYSELLIFIFFLPYTFTGRYSNYYCIIKLCFVAKKNQLAFICSVLRFSSSELQPWAERCRAELKCRCRTDPPPPPPPEPWSRSPDAKTFCPPAFAFAVWQNGRGTQRSRIWCRSTWCCQRGNAWGGAVRAAVCISHLYRARVHTLYYADERKIMNVL